MFQELTNAQPLPILGIPQEGAGNWPKDWGIGEMTSTVGSVPTTRTHGFSPVSRHGFADLISIERDPRE
jgi:hypothetical protein